ncbi:DUF2635 domain-containing protein [Rhodoplanes serenus]|uniref:DUF2635 domain-containing protein n=1 Tax=Rhodoplanes serenus TaxID=200615 RepID=A0A9X4XPS5_9BRAD|nr:DUF2635 domain-containing protein [Rhodoplanes serenus]MTW19092.1 DUF2635 domain-containing protein [Rhodoplanes serenus]
MHAETAYLKPADGRRVPLPDGTPWPAGGARVEIDRYVRRRIADGDLVPAEPPETAGQPVAEAEAAAKPKKR